MPFGEQDKEEKSVRQRFVSCISMRSRMFVARVEMFSTRRRVYQPDAEGPAIGFLRSGSSGRLT